MNLFKKKQKKPVTLDLRAEYKSLLEKWETQWSIMSNNEVKRFLVLDKKIKNEQKKQG